MTAVQKPLKVLKTYYHSVFYSTTNVHSGSTMTIAKPSAPAPFLQTMYMKPVNRSGESVVPTTAKAMSHSAAKPEQSVRQMIHEVLTTSATMSAATSGGPCTPPKPVPCPPPPPKCPPPPPKCPPPPPCPPPPCPPPKSNPLKAVLLGTAALLGGYLLYKKLCSAPICTCGCNRTDCKKPT